MKRSATLVGIAALLATTSAIAQMACEQKSDGDCSSTGRYIEVLDGRINPTTHSVTLAHSPVPEEPIRLFHQGREATTVSFTIKKNVLTLSQAQSADDQLSIEYYSTSRSDNRRAEVSDLRRQVIGNAIEAESDMLLQGSDAETNPKEPRSLRGAYPEAEPIRKGKGVYVSRALSLLEDDISTQTSRRHLGSDQVERNRSFSVQGVDGMGDEAPSLTVFKALNPNRHRSAVDELQSSPDERSLRSGSRAIDMLVKRARTQQSQEGRRQ